MKIDYSLSIKETHIIKCFAISAMLFHHLFFRNIQYGESILKIALTSKVCVAIFVFLSGYGLSIQFSKIKWNHSQVQRFKQTLVFLIKRLIKFYFSYWLIFIISVPIGIFLFNRSLEIPYGENSTIVPCLIKDFFGLQGLSSYNITWWFNRLIIILYALFPIVYWGMRSNIISGLVLFILFINPFRMLTPLDILAGGLSCYAITFALGIFCALRYNNINKVLNIITPKYIFFILFPATSFLLYARNNVLSLYFYGNTVDPFISVALAFCITSLLRWRSYKFKLLEFIGKHSTNIYLTHTFIYSYFFPKFSYSSNSPIIIFLQLIFTTLVISCLLEAIKKHTHYYDLQNKILCKISIFAPKT